MAAVVRMPSVLAGATEASIASWLVSPGDAVITGTPLAEIETEKALVEYAAEEAGTVGRLVLGPGDRGEVGDPIAVLVAPGETDADIDAALGVAAPAASRPAVLPVPAGAPAGVPAGAGSATGAPSAPPFPSATAWPTRQHGGSGRVFASPLVRRLATERGVDLAGMAGSGTGPNGRIVRRDLERFLADAGAAVAGVRVPAAAAVPATGVAAGDQAEQAPVLANAVTSQPAGTEGTASAGATLIPHTPMRRAVARRLSESKATIPHFYLTAECVVDEMLALRDQVNETSRAKISVNDFVLAAVAAAFVDVPQANVSWSADGLRQYRSVDISIAVATEGGLVTPVLRGVEGKRLSAVARESADLVQRARTRKLRQHELEGGTFTVSNLGMYGTAEFAAIINPPQSGILAVGAARPQPVVANGAVVAATVMRCTLSVDHRAIDGADAARWLAAFSARLENPLGALV
jgi:pyruvate dehydrogenase E2 component (dihydrolipoamide acetyltransferase)